MYTDTLQTFVILGGAFVLMGYGMELNQWGRGTEVASCRVLHLGAEAAHVSSMWVLGRALAWAPGPLTALPSQPSTRWAGIQGFSTNTWGQ